MNRARYDNRAKWLNQNYRENQAQQLPVDMSRDDYWSKCVRSKEDIENFYKIYYPQLPDVLAKALADYYQRAIDGQIELPEEFTAKYYQKKQEKERWAFEEELKQQELEGKINLTKKRLEDLMSE